MMFYVISKNKEVQDLKKRLIELHLLQEDGKLIKLNGSEVGLPLCESTLSQETIDNGCLVVDGSYYMLHKRLDLPPEIPKKPYELMKCGIILILKSKKLWRDELANEIPKSWVKYGEMVVFDSKSFVDPAWENAGDELWTTICSALKVNRIARRHTIRPDGFRSPRVEILCGDNTWVTAIDGEIRYTWDVQLCMFSPGNATERFRISQLDCREETIVDLYSGIGYFTLPFLVHAQAEFVHACEWNPAAVMALRCNLFKNKVADRCCVHQGDNREVCPKDVADRVYMGLIPTCQPGIKTACLALKFHSGGILHLHENVSSYRKTCSNFNLPSTSSTVNQPPAKPVSDLPSEPPCQQCHDILIKFPKALLRHIEDSFQVTHEDVSKGKFSLSFYLEGNEGDSEWCTTSQIVWKKKEWFLQALHSSHTVCTTLSTFHNCPWKVEFINLHHVKSYAPHIDHLVFDLKCTPIK